MQRSSTASVLAATDGDLFARMSTVSQVTGLGRATIYRLIADDQFPAQVRIGAHAVDWPSTKPIVGSMNAPVRVALVDVRGCRRGALRSGEQRLAFDAGEELGGSDFEF
jgi:prophage regulatory protein